MSGLGGVAGSGMPEARPRGAIGVVISRLVRQVRRSLHRARSVLGIRRGVKVRGAYFKELSADSLQRALSKKGRGWKDYRVTFPDGSKLVIRCTPQRIFDDLMGPLGFDAGHGVLAPLLEIIRPGSRLLLLNAGTGAAGAWLGRAVGASGAVVALEEDEQSVAFAVKRYPRPNVSFERGDIGELAGEIDAAFDGAVVVRPMVSAIPDLALAEIWRVVAPGGWVLIACSPGSGASVAAAIRSLPAGDAAGIRTDVTGGPDLVFAAKLAEPVTSGRDAGRAQGNRDEPDEDPGEHVS